MFKIRFTARKPQGCDLCGEVRELRPYGPKEEWICVECGTKDEPAVRRAIRKRLIFGDERLGDTK